MPVDWSVLAFSWGPYAAQKVHLDQAGSADNVGASVVVHLGHLFSLRTFISGFHFVSLRQAGA